MRPKAGELLAYGHRNRQTGKPEVIFEGGEGVDQADINWLTVALSEPQYTILCLRGKEPPNRPFLEELDVRDFDVTTFRFSVSLKSANVPQPKRLQRIRIRSRTLQVRWARDPDHDADLCCSWDLPCTRRDKNLAFGLFTTIRYTAAQAALGEYQRDTLLTELEVKGFDIRTLRLEVKKFAEQDQPTEVHVGAAA